MFSGFVIPGKKPKMAISKPIKIAIVDSMSVMIQSLERNGQMLRGSTFFHQVRGLFIRVAKAHAGVKKNICPIPPPTRKRRMNNAKKTVRPYLVWMNHSDQITIVNPKIIDSRPEIRKLGIMVKASSVPKTQNLCASPIA